MIWHLLPEIENHSLSITCDCNPKVDIEENSENILVIHNSFKIKNIAENIIEIKRI